MSEKSDRGICTTTNFQREDREPRGLEIAAELDAPDLPPEVSPPDSVVFGCANFLSEVAGFMRTQKGCLGIFFKQR